MVALVLVAAVVLPSEDQADLKALADRLHASVLQVRGRTVRDGREVLSFGSGVLVGSGMAVTTLHAVAVGSAVVEEIEVLAPEAAPMAAHVAAAFPQIDLALLQLDGGASLAAPALAASDPAAGDVLIAMGADENEVTVVGVTVAEVHDGVAALVSPHLIDSRFWGGPLFDTHGQLAAVSLTAIVAPRAVTAGTLRALIQQARESRPFRTPTVVQ